MTEKIPGERLPVVLLYHREGEARRAARYVRKELDTDVEPVLIGAARDDSPAESPYTVERLIGRVLIDDSLLPSVQLRIALYWQQRGVFVDTVRIRPPR